MYKHTQWPVGHACHSLNVLHRSCLSAYFCTFSLINYIFVRNKREGIIHTDLNRDMGEKNGDGGLFLW